MIDDSKTTADDRKAKAIANLKAELEKEKRVLAKLQRLGGKNPEDKELKYDDEVIEAIAKSWREKHPNEFPQNPDGSFPLTPYELAVMEELKAKRDLRTTVAKSITYLSNPDRHLTIGADTDSKMPIAQTKQNEQQPINPLHPRKSLVDIFASIIIKVLLFFIRAGKSLFSSKAQKPRFFARKSRLLLFMIVAIVCLIPLLISVASIMSVRAFFTGMPSGAMIPRGPDDRLMMGIIAVVFSVSAFVIPIKMFLFLKRAGKSWWNHAADVSGSSSDINAKDFFSRSALDNAIESGDPQRVKEVLQKGAQINDKSKGKTALDRAVSGGHTEVVRVLVEHGAEINMSVLIDTAGSGNIELVQLFLERGCDPNTAGNYGLTPLMLAVWNGHTNVVSALLAKGANPNAFLTEDWPLSENSYRFFVQHFATYKGATALMMACAWGQVDIVSALIGRGADVSRRTATIGSNKKGASALSIAELSGGVFPGAAEMIQGLLKNAGATS